MLSGTHNVSGNPAFAPDGYHLTVHSAAINSGVNAGVMTDMDGNPRPDCAAWDIGAVEYQGLLCWRVYLPVVLRQ